VQFRHDQQQREQARGRAAYNQPGDKPGDAFRVRDGALRIAHGEFRIAHGEFRFAYDQFRVADGEFGVAHGEQDHV
jgi:hypothetical protein